MINKTRYQVADVLDHIDKVQAASSAFLQHHFQNISPLKVGSLSMPLRMCYLATKDRKISRLFRMFYEVLSSAHR